MKSYDGFQIRCGCHCINCHKSVYLEGYADAEGSHFCPSCNNYIKVFEDNCQKKTPELIRRREKIIIESGADKA